MIGRVSLAFEYWVLKTLMTSIAANEYKPDFVSAPGEILQELLRERGLTQADLAERTGRPKKTINEIIHAKTAITPETALQLEHVLGVPASFWNNLESHYRESLARAEETERLAEYVDWLKGFPVAEMVKWGWIRSRKKKADKVRELLAFFGVASPAQWETVFATSQASFRQSTAFRINLGAVAAWLRQGELGARDIETKPFSRHAFRKALRSARTLTTEPAEVFQPKLEEFCASAGVAVVFLPTPTGCRASGAARWLTSDKAIIQLSLRGKSDDLLWFTFFHEAGHILRHGKRRVFLDATSGKEKKIAAKEEEEAKPVRRGNTYSTARVC